MYGARHPSTSLVTTDGCCVKPRTTAQPWERLATWPFVGAGGNSGGWVPGTVYCTPNSMHCLEGAHHMTQGKIQFRKGLLLITLAALALSSCGHWKQGGQRRLPLHVPDENPHFTSDR